MTSPSAAFSFPVKVEKKRILLVATYATKRDLRARVLRKLGVEVDCAADIGEARSLWRADTYDLVLVDVRNDSGNVEEFCVEIKSAKPPQRIAYLVGKPGYLAASPCLDIVVPLPAEISGAPWARTVAALFTTACEALPRRWGFQEASWRIAATRLSLKDPRGKKISANDERPQQSWSEAVKLHSKSSPTELGASLGLPSIQLSSIDLPAIDLPAIELPHTELPAIEIPKEEIS
jgi:CheY-like chemotaxis protein